MSCPCTGIQITLYELGAWSVHPSHKPLFIGTAAGYQRAADVQIQTRLVRPELKISHSIDEIATQIESWFATKSTGSGGSDSADVKSGKSTPGPANAKPLKQPTAEQIESRIQKIRDSNVGDAFDMLVFPDDEDTGMDESASATAAAVSVGSGENRIAAIFGSHFGRYLSEIDGDSNDFNVCTPQPDRLIDEIDI